MSIVDVDETVAETVAEVGPRKRGQVLAFVVCALAAIAAGIDGFLFGSGAVHAAAVGAGVLGAVLACLAPFAPRLRRPIHVPVHPDSEVAYLESIVLDRTSKNADEIKRLRAEMAARDEQVYRVLDRLSSASGWFASEVERALADDLPRANS